MNVVGVSCQLGCHKKTQCSAWIRRVKRLCLNFRALLLRDIWNVWRNCVIITRRLITKSIWTVVRGRDILESSCLVSRKIWFHNLCWLLLVLFSATFSISGLVWVKVVYLWRTEGYGQQGHIDFGLLYSCFVLLSTRVSMFMITMRRDWEFITWRCFFRLWGYCKMYYSLGGMSFLLDAQIPLIRNVICAVHHEDSQQIRKGLRV